MAIIQYKGKVWKGKHKAISLWLQVLGCKYVEDKRDWIDIAEIGRALKN